MARSFSMAQSAKALAGVTGLALAGLAGIAAAGGAGTSSEALLRSSFSAAIDRSAPVLERAAASLPVAGSEDFWLSAMRADTAHNVSKAVAIGDQISMTLDGEDRRYTVQSVSEVAPEVTTIDTAPAAARYVLVTARDSKDPQAKAVRLVLEISDVQGNRLTARDRAL